MVSMLLRCRVRFRSADCASAISAKCVRVERSAGVDLDLVAGLGVFQGDDPDVRQDFFAFVLHVDGDEIVPPSGDCEFAREIAGLEIRDEKNDRAPGDDFVQIAQSERGIGPAGLAARSKEFRE